MIMNEEKSEHNFNNSKNEKKALPLELLVEVLKEANGLFYNNLNKGESKEEIEYERVKNLLTSSSLVNLFGEEIFKNTKLANIKKRQDYKIKKRAMLENLNDCLIESNRQTEQIEACIKQIRSMSRRLKQSSKQLRESSDRLKESSKHLKESIKSVKTKVENAKNIIEKNLCSKKETLKRKCQNEKESPIKLKIQKICDEGQSTSSGGDLNVNNEITASESKLKDNKLENTESEESDNESVEDINEEEDGESDLGGDD